MDKEEYEKTIRFKTLEIRQIKILFTERGTKQEVVMREKANELNFVNISFEVMDLWLQSTKS